MDQSAARVVVPADPVSALENGVQAEIENIAKYDKFLSTAAATPLPADVRETFERLKAASENHLRAFRTNLPRYE